MLTYKLDLMGLIIIACPLLVLTESSCKHFSKGLGYGGNMGMGRSSQNDVVGLAQSMGECIDLVKSKAPFSNGASWNGEGNKECVATIEQDWVNVKEDSWQNCFIEPVKVNGYDNGDDCLIFVNKATSWGKSILVGSADDMRHCVKLVKQKYPEARGATMDHPWLSLPQFKCYAHLDDVANTKLDFHYTFCWLRSPLETSSEKYSYPGCKVTIFGTARGSESHYLGETSDMNDCMRLYQESEHKERANAIEMLNWPPGRAAGYSCSALYDSTGSKNNGDETWIGCYFNSPHDLDPVRPKELDGVSGVYYSLFGYEMSSGWPLDTGMTAFGEVANVEECVHKAQNTAGEACNAIMMDNPLHSADTYTCWGVSRCTGTQNGNHYTYVTLFIEPKQNLDMWPTEKTTTTAPTTTTTTTTAPTTSATLPVCAEFDRVDHLEVASCESIKVKDSSRACNNMFDNSLTQNVKSGHCFLSQSSRRGWVEVTLAKTSKIAQVTILAKGTGTELPGAKVEVCQDDKCTFFKKIGTFDKRFCTHVRGPELSGNKIRISIKGSALAVCEMRVYSS